MTGGMWAGRGAGLVMGLVLMLAWGSLSAGCDDRPQERYGLSPDLERQFDNFEIAEAYCRYVIDRDYEQAYALMSRSTRQRMAFDAFVSMNEETIEQFGPPLHYRVDNLVDGDLLHTDLHGFSDDVPPEARSARVGLRMATEVDPDEPRFHKDWFYCWVNIVHEDDGLAIDTVEYEPSSTPRWPD